MIKNVPSSEPEDEDWPFDEYDIVLSDDEFGELALAVVLWVVWSLDEVVESFVTSVSA